VRRRSCQRGFLETRKLRLLLLAYLRGLIRSDYSQGLRSIVREDLILDALAAEKDVEFALKRLNTEAMFVAANPGERSGYILKQLCQRLSSWRDAAEFNFSTLNQGQITGSVDALIKLYEALKATGMIKNTPPTKTV
jgi:hypothetical protein